jgi:glutathione peroxidase
MDSIYHFKVKNSAGEDVSLKQFKGKVLLIVNTASKCGFTPQYKGLQNLYEKFKNKGFYVLVFPCNQFAGQEPGSAEEINAFCTLNYGVTFPVFAKIDVNGKNADPLFNFLKKACPGFITNSIKWNFTKFLIDRSGTPLRRYAPFTKPEKIIKNIEKFI